MVNIPQAALDKMLSAIPDQGTRRTLADIAAGKVVCEISCMSKTCKGRVIGHVYSSGHAVPTKDEDGLYHLRAVRIRLDGHMGAQCWCGNDSRLCAEEKPEMATADGNPPTKDGLERIYGRLRGKSGYAEKEGITQIDGFAYKRLRGG